MWEERNEIEYNFRCGLVLQLKYLLFFQNVVDETTENVTKWWNGMFGRSALHSGHL